MMTNEELLAVLRLQATKNIGDVIAKKLIGVFGSAEAVFKQKPLFVTKVNGVGTYVAEQLFKTEYIKKAEQELNYILKNNIEFTYFLEDDYPENLKNCIDSPILIFKKGNLSYNNKRIISVVGTRNITNYGKEFTEKLITDLKHYKPVIVSGFAFGCDIAAHKAAMDNDLQTIAVLAHGLDRIYPGVHKKYVDKVCQNGGFLTEFWHKEEPLRENFLKRNRIVAGISQATIVVESAEKGGSLVTADIANSYNKDVFALSGRYYDPYSKGCNNLIKNNKAHLLSSAEDIVKMLNWDIETKPKKQLKQMELFVNLNETEQKIYDYLQQNGKQLLDLIAIDCEIPVHRLSSLLISMELKGVVKPLPGKMFEV